MKRDILKIIDKGVSDIEKVKHQYPKMNTQDVIDILNKLKQRIKELN